MLAEGRRQIGPLNLWHPSPVGAKRQAGEFFLDSLALSRIGTLAQPMGKGKEAFLLSFTGAQPGLDQIDQNSIGAGVPIPGCVANPLSQRRGKRYTLTDGPARFRHASFYTVLCCFAVGSDSRPSPTRPRRQM